MSAEIIPKQLIGQTARAYIGIEEYQGRKRNVIRYYLDPVPDLLAKLLLASWGSWLIENPCPPNERGAPTINLWIPKAVSACLFRKLPPTRAADLIRRAMTRREKGPREVERTVERIYGGSLTGSPKPRVELSSYDPERLAARAAVVPFEVTTDWLAEQSPECVLDVSPAQFLDSLFRPEERVAVKRHESDIGFIYHPGDVDLAKELNAYVKQSKVGAWYYANPVDGERRESGACYGDDRTSDYRHLMIESDDARRDLWLAMLVQTRAPILSMYESGGRSIHAIVRVNATSKAELDAISAGYKRVLIPLGMCAGSGKATQATRLPGVYRADRGRWQRLLYLEPNATVEPIYKRSAADPVTSRIGRENNVK